MSNTKPSPCHTFGCCHIANTTRECAGWLNELVAQLWPNVNVAGSKMVKEIVEPMFKDMLPGPLSSLHFTKIDFGHVPFKFSNVKVTKTEVDGIKLDLNVDWAGTSSSPVSIATWGSPLTCFTDRKV